MIFIEILRKDTFSPETEPYMQRGEFLMKKKLLSLVLALALGLSLTVTAAAADHTVAIPFRYNIATSFSEGLAMVSKNGKCGYIDQTGTVVIPCKYDSAGSFSEGLAVVSDHDGNAGFINKTGTVVIPRGYDLAQSFSEGLAAVKQNGKWGFIDKTGAMVIPCAYDRAGNFSEGLAAVQRNGKCGYIDQTGAEVIPCKYLWVENFSEGLAPVCPDGRYDLIDKTGAVVTSLPRGYDIVKSFSDGLAPVQINSKWGFIDKTGTLVIPHSYDSVASFSEGLASVYRDDKWGLIDKTGAEVVPCEYASGGSFSEGLAPVMDENRKWGYITVDTLTSEWAEGQVAAAAENGLVPDGLGIDYRVSITRAQFAAVAVKLYEVMSGNAVPAAGESPFSDTGDAAVIQAQALGIVSGVGNGKFDPYAPVTREQAAAMLSRVYTKLGGEIPAVSDTGFADDGSISGWAKSAVAFMADREILSGVGNNQFDPCGNASIEQALSIALRMFQNLK